MKTTQDILRSGHSSLREADRSRESAKQGQLRGGTVGALISSDSSRAPLGTLLGKCSRIALARYLGWQSEAESNRSLMFAGGFSNEDDWMKVLRAGHEGPILREEEIPIRWTTSGGVAVTGRPDIVLCTGDPAKPVPQRGLELKSVMSVGTALDVLVRQEPKTEHLIQAAHYQWQLGIPWEIWYTSRVDWPILGWLMKEFAGWFSRDIVFGESILEYRDSGAAKKILPFYCGFELDIRADIVYYRPAGSESDWRGTVVTTDSIRDYYELVADMAENKHLGPRPSNLTIHGEYQGFNKCDAKYCPFSEICDRHERNYDDWIAAVEEKCK